MMIRSITEGDIFGRQPMQVMNGSSSVWLYVINECGYGRYEEVEK